MRWVKYRVIRIKLNRLVWGKRPCDRWLTNKLPQWQTLLRVVTYKMAAKTSWHRYGTKLRHCHRIYTETLWSVGLPGLNSIAAVMRPISMSLSASWFNASANSNWSTNSCPSGILCTRLLQYYTIQYKFVKRHVAVASEALANRSVKKHRRRRTNVL